MNIHQDIGPSLRAKVSMHAGHHAWHWRDHHQRHDDRQFFAMRDAFEQQGGLALGDEVAGLMRSRCEQPVSMLARWIVARRVVSFSWRSQTLLPLFQFDRIDMSLHAATCDVVAELVPVFDDWDLASWFAHPNSWLGGASPVDTIARDPASTVQAARADRFIAHG